MPEDVLFGKPMVRAVTGVSRELLQKYGFINSKGKGEEAMEIEQVKGDGMSYGETGYPDPVHRYRLELESFTDSIEESYFWILDFIREEWGYPHVIKITDVFSAAENSAFFGVSQQRLGLQQDKVSQFLATIGKMIKDLFQLVRELRVLNERLGYYMDSYDTSSKSRGSAEITLKGVWIDMVEQGSKNPASVYGMARELGFTTLPDLFFQTHPIMATDVDEVVERLDFNLKIKEVLKRKLRTFLEWKQSTYKELQAKKKFTLKYLRQHFDVIKLYIDWVKPYLRNIRKLQMHQGKFSSADLITAFENSLIEVEILFCRPFGNWFACVLVNFDYRTRPAMSYQQEGYQRGPLHAGKVQWISRGYVWDKTDIENYIKMKDEDAFELISIVDSSLKAAMEALGDELMGYLREAGETFMGEEEPKVQKSKPKTSFGYFLDPFVSVGKGFMSIPKSPIKKEKTEKSGGRASKTQGSDYVDYTKAKSYVKKTQWDCYKNYKKAHKMLAW